MQEVKKLNIVRIKPLILGSFLLLTTGTIEAQYSTIRVIPDSTKIEILSNHSLTVNPLLQKTDFSKSRTNMPIFCKWELDIEDASKIPIKFRLGGQDYVDRLENKRTIIKD